MGDYNNYFKESMNSRELGIQYLKLCDMIGQNDIEELEKMDKIYYRILNVIRNRQNKEADEGWMTSY